MSIWVSKMDTFFAYGHGHMTSWKKIIFDIFSTCTSNKCMNVYFYSNLINCYTTLNNGNFGTMSIYLHWKLKVDNYYGTKISFKKRLYCGTEGVV